MTTPAAKTGPKTVVPGRRLYLNEQKTMLVDSHDPRARELYCTDTQSVPAEEYQALLAATTPIPEKKLEDPAPPRGRRARDQQ